MSEGREPEGYRYEWDLSEAKGILDKGDVVSFKIRPIESIDISHDRYVYMAEYKEIYELLSKYKIEWEGRINHGNAKKYKIRNTEIVIVEHETGPEIIIYLGMIAAGATAVKTTAEAGQEVIKLINMICEIIRKHANDKNEGKESDRYYGAGAISIERRVGAVGKVLRQVAITAKAFGDVIKSVQELISQK